MGRDQRARDREERAAEARARWRREWKGLPEPARCDVCKASIYEATVYAVHEGGTVAFFCATCFPLAMSCEIVPHTKKARQLSPPGPIIDPVDTT